jgi:hypothetical protein
MSLIDVYFISEETLKDRSWINENCDSGELRYGIQTAQNLNIQETLGNPLYEKLLSDVSANTVTGYYKLLLDTYVVPATISWSIYHLADNFFVKWMNVGLVSNRTEQGNPIDYRTFQYIKNNAKSTAEFYDQNMRRYLCAYASRYPEYNTVEIGKLLPQRDSAYRSSIAMGSTKFYPMWYGGVNTIPQGTFPAGH